ncbi:MAG: hypothetical protein U0165_03075 [Polyangiaceae bacterium]
MTPNEASDIAAQLLMPLRPCESQAREVMDKHHDLDEAWDALCTHGLTPKRREIVGFWAPRVCSECHGVGDVHHTVRTPRDHEHYVVSGCAVCKRRGLEPPIKAAERPASRELALALASNPRGIEAVYEMACEAASSLSAWEPSSAADQALWSRLDQLPTGNLHRLHNQEPTIARTRFAPRATRVLQSAKAAVKREVSSRVFRQWIDELARWVHPFKPHDPRSHFGMAQARAASDLEGYFWWTRAVLVDAEVSPSLASPLAGRAFASLGDPFAPLVAIWRLGYALERFIDGYFVLVAPDVPP